MAARSETQKRAGLGHIRPAYRGFAQCGTHFEQANPLVLAPLEAAHIVQVHEVASMGAQKPGGVEFLLKPRYRPGTEQLLVAPEQRGVVAVGARRQDLGRRGEESLAVALEGDALQPPCSFGNGIGGACGSRFRNGCAAR